MLKGYVGPGSDCLGRVEQGCGMVVGVAGRRQGQASGRSAIIRTFGGIQQGAATAQARKDWYAV